MLHYSNGSPRRVRPDHLLSREPSDTVATVLVVDDEDSVCQMLCRLITELGHRVYVAHDALSALDLVRTHEVHVAVCDIVMAERDGIWLIDRLRQEFPDVRIVVVTGLRDMDPQVTLRPGVEAYLVKPFPVRQFAEVLRQVLNVVRANASRSAN